MEAYSTDSLEKLAARLDYTAHDDGSERIRKCAELLRNTPDEIRRELREELEEMLLRMDSNEASDMDIGGLGCSNTVWYRVHGQKKPDTDYQYSLAETDLMLLNVLNPTQIDTLIINQSLDFSYTLENAEGVKQRYRSTMYLDLDHLAMNMRSISTQIRPFGGLGLHPEAAKLLSLNYMKYGLTLVTGITGSGKSSTLDTIIDANNRTIEAHIVIIASPIEMVHKPKKCIIRHREVGRDVTSFKAGAVQSLRQDPDIIVIGELRDPDTIQTALEITDSGHKTFATLHTASATESIDRIIGEVQVDQQERVRNRLADVLTCVISQKLLPSTDGKRVLAKEVLVVTPSVRAAIRNNTLGEIYQMINEGGSAGMITMEQDLKRLYQEDKITIYDAISHANNKKRLREILGLEQQ